MGIEGYLKILLKYLYKWNLCSQSYGVQEQGFWFLFFLCVFCLDCSYFLKVFGIAQVVQVIVVYGPPHFRQHPS